MPEYTSSEEEDNNEGIENAGENESSEAELSNEGENEGDAEQEGENEGGSNDENEDGDISAEDNNNDAENEVNDKNDKLAAEENTENGDEEYEEEMEELVEEEDEDEEDENGNPKLHCICQQPKGPGLVGCDFCREFFHPPCLKLPQDDEAMLAAKDKGNWACPNCQLTRMKNELKIPSINDINSDYRNNGIASNDNIKSKIETAPFSKFQPSDNTSQNGLFGNKSAGGFGTFANNNHGFGANMRSGSSEEVQNKGSWQNGNPAGTAASKTAMSAGNNLLKPSNMSGLMSKNSQMGQPTSNNLFNHAGNKPSNMNPFARNTSDNKFSTPASNNPFQPSSGSNEQTNLVSRIMNAESNIDMLMKRVQLLEEQIEKGDFEGSSSSLEVKKPTGEVVKTAAGFNNIINKLKDIHGREVNNKGMKLESPAAPPNNVGNWNPNKLPTHNTNINAQPFHGSNDGLGMPKAVSSAPAPNYGGKKSTLPKDMTPPNPGVGKPVGEGLMRYLQQIKGEPGQGLISYYHCSLCNHMTTRKGRAMQHMTDKHSLSDIPDAGGAAADGNNNTDTEDSMDGMSGMPNEKIGKSQSAPGARRCKFCEDTFDKAQNLKNHTLNHFKEEISSQLFSQISVQPPFNCPKCTLVQRDKISILRHYAFNHKVILEHCDEDDLKGLPADSAEGASRQPNPTAVSKEPKMISVAPMGQSNLPQREFLKLREDDWNTALQLAARARQDYQTKLNERSNLVNSSAQQQGVARPPSSIGSTPANPNPGQGKVSSGILKLMKFGEIKKEKVDPNNNNLDYQRAANSPSNAFRPSSDNQEKPKVSSGILKLMKFGDIKKEKTDQNSNSNSTDQHGNTPNKRTKLDDNLEGGNQAVTA